MSLLTCSPGYLRRHEVLLLLVGEIAARSCPGCARPGLRVPVGDRPQGGAEGARRRPALILVGGHDSAAGCRILRDDARMGEAWLLAVTDRDDSRRGGAPGRRRRLRQRPFTRTELLARTRAGVRAAQQRSDDTLLRALMVNVPGAIYRSAGTPTTRSR